MYSEKVRFGSCSEEDRIVVERSWEVGVGVGGVGGSGRGTDVRAVRGETSEGYG